MTDVTRFRAAPRLYGKPSFPGLKPPPAHTLGQPMSYRDRPEATTRGRRRPRQSERKVLFRLAMCRSLVYTKPMTTTTNSTATLPTIEALRSTPLVTCAQAGCRMQFHFVLARKHPTLCISHADDREREIVGWTAENSVD
jgi:hypothetical protein